MLAGLLLASLPGCHYVPKPPTPTLLGPDTGWTHVPTSFTIAFTHQSGHWVTQADFDWGDSSFTWSVYNHLDESITHVYSEPGTYLARARLENLYVDEYTSVCKVGDWSNPCTVQIVQSGH